jgi:hypothetical protein
VIVWSIFEMHQTIEAAITREKQIKEWRRSWKLNLIESVNPDWFDLWEQITKERPPWLRRPERFTLRAGSDLHRRICSSTAHCNPLGPDLRRGDE